MFVEVSIPPVPFFTSIRLCSIVRLGERVSRHTAFDVDVVHAERGRESDMKIIFTPSASAFGVSYFPPKSPQQSGGV